MTALAVLLGSLGLADLVSGGLSGSPPTRSRALSGVALGWGLAVAWIGIVPYPGRALIWSGFVLVACCGWILPRIGTRPPVWRMNLAMAVLGGAIAVGLLVSGSSIGEPPEIVGRWATESPFPILSSRSAPELALGVAALLFLSATSNGVVRAVLRVAGTKITGGEKRLRGGRYIGVIERFLIFGLALAGQATAAALVVSAKSILRFPELSWRARGAEGGDEITEDEEVGVLGPKDRDGDSSNGVVADVDVVTEYFLLGSLTSWLLALAPVLFFR